MSEKSEYEVRLGHDFVNPNSRVARFMDEQHMLLEKYRNEILHLKTEIVRLESESDYWKKECEASDARIRKLTNG